MEGLRRGREKRMADREKVIKGLECCATNRMRREDCEAMDCAYLDLEEKGCIHQLIRDALVLLKAQQPRVMTLGEVKASKGADMYLEISTRTDEIPYITAATLDGVGTKGVTFYCSNFDFVAYNRRLYGWRCWTPARPTDAQREAEPWE